MSIGGKVARSGPVWQSLRHLLLLVIEVDLLQALDDRCLSTWHDELLVTIQVAELLVRPLRSLIKRYSTFHFLVREFLALEHFDR